MAGSGAPWAWHSGMLGNFWGTLVHSSVHEAQSPVLLCPLRRAAASNLGKFGLAVEPDHLAKDLLPQFQALSMDGARTDRFIFL